MKKTLMYGLAFAGVLFTACQSDDIKPGGEGMNSDGERALFVNLNIKSDVSGSESRSGESNGDPVAGSTDFGNGESDVNEAYFVFYDQTGAVVGDPARIPLTGDNVTTGTNVSGTVEKYYQSTVRVTIGNGQNNPTQVICYINPQNAESLSKPLDVIQLETRRNLYSENAAGTKFFSMSNSVYYTSETSDAPQIAVQIAPNQLFNTREQAQNALEDDDLTVNIYVERYAAKLAFQAVEADPYVTYSQTIDNLTQTPVTLKFDAKTWMLNASCQESYVVKSFREESPTGSILDDNYGFNELDAIINKNAGNWDWNNASYHRSYWGMSPAYFTAEYPEVSSDVEGLTLHQHYYSYDELINGIGGNQPVGFTVSDSYDTQFVHTTTVGSKALASRNIVAALASVILVGDYTVEIGDQVLTNTDFYTYLQDANTEKPIVYFAPDKDSSVGTSSVTDGESILRKLISAATNLYKQVTDETSGEVSYTNFNFSDEDDMARLVAVFTVAEPSAAVKGGLKVPERYRTLQLRSGVTSDQLAGIYVGTPEGYMTINANPDVTTPTSAAELTLIMANQELMKVVGFAAKYTAGAAYFNIPVKHYGWYRTTNTNKPTTANPNPDMDWSKVRVGDFGVVRNHSYKIDVTEILGLGTGIGGKGNPIVPPAEENRYYIAYSVNILQWAIVPTQGVKL